MTRYRRKLVESRSAERNRLLKLLETANIKLASVATDVFGVSGRLMLQALVQTTATSQQMADLAKGFCARRFPNRSWLWKESSKITTVSCWACNYSRLQAVEEDHRLLEHRIHEKLKSYSMQLALLQQIPGVDWTLAAVIISELGVDDEYVRKCFTTGFLGGDLPRQQRIGGEA